MSHIEWIIERTIERGFGNSWWVATTHDTADIAYRRTKSRLNGYIDAGPKKIKVGEPIPFRSNDTRRIIFLGGATIWFKSAEKPDNLFGEDVHDLVGDEMTRWRQAAWTACYTTLTATKGRAKLIGNVKGSKNYAYKLARRAESKVANDWSYHKLTADDAVQGGVLDQETIDQAKQDLPEDVFFELYYAQATEDGSNPFGLQHIENVMGERSKKKAVCYGVDLAKSADFTWIIGLDEDGRQCESVRFNKRPWMEVAKSVFKICGERPILVDSTGVGDPVLEMIIDAGCVQAEGYVFTGGVNGSKQKLMEGLAVAIQNGLITFWDERLKAELQLIEYAVQRTGVTYEAPAGDHDDGVMSAGLAWKCYRDRPVYSYRSTTD